ncbi:hypothetical protein ABFS83_01G058900 [Erythranthe nasuta]
MHTSRVIHRYLNPANVLLDGEMEARIADFGLAVMVSDAADTHVSASNLVGTVGYIAPEYNGTLTFTNKCDVYSFGVMLGALVMGKFPSDDFFQETNEMSLVGWMRGIRWLRMIRNEQSNLSYWETGTTRNKCSCFSRLLAFVH